MPVTEDIIPLVRRDSALPFERLRVINDWENLGLPQIRRGILFLYAAWSGPAILAFKRLTAILNEIDTSSLDLIVLDTDCLNAEEAAILWGGTGFSSGGWGEVFWIRDGQIVIRSLILSTDAQNIIAQNTAALLDDSSS